MEEEAEQAGLPLQGQSARLQRSVEPTAATADSAPADLEVEPFATLSKETEQSVGQQCAMQDEGLVVDDSQLLDTQMEFSTAIEPGISFPALPFDLNEECPIALEGEQEINDLLARVILGDAEERMNKDARDNAVHKGAARSLIKYTAPLKKALLCNPPSRLRSTVPKKQPSLDASTVSQGAKKKLPKAPAKHSNITLNDQATAFLMKTCGGLGQQDRLDDLAKQKLAETFTTHLQAEMVGNVRDAFGILDDGGATAFSALLSAADVENE
jgi:hypothetical protein